jgi:hypothetical protein
MKQVWLAVLLPGCLATVLVGSLGAQQTTVVGRWVNLDPMDFRLLVLDVEPDRTVHQLIPAPQFSATYSFEAGRVLVRMGDGSALSLILQDDTLSRNGQATLTRFLGRSEEKGSVRGTWRPAATGAMEQFWTFRSDGQLILEVGFPGSVTLTGDTLTVAGESFKVRLVEDTLYVENPSKQRRFVRRPWGCLGTQPDTRAPECREAA